MGSCGTRRREPWEEGELLQKDPDQGDLQWFSVVGGAGQRETPESVGCLLCRKMLLKGTPAQPALTQGAPVPGGCWEAALPCLCSQLPHSQFCVIKANTTQTGSAESVSGWWPHTKDRAGSQMCPESGV